jgi:peptide-methionine (R)-S-oxide reductase
MATVSRAMMIGGVLAAAATFRASFGRASAGTGQFPVRHTDAEWHARLNPQQFAVLRESDTENHETRPGIYACAGCNLAAFDAKTKFDSGTGWPSFYEPLPHAIQTSSDSSLGEERTEVHCSRCGSHLGHVFDDGPRPTGLRYCMNGVALAFKPRSA